MSVPTSLRALFEKHRAHIRQSPGAGASEQRYALATIDDIEADLAAASEAPSPPAEMTIDDAGIIAHALASLTNDMFDDDVVGAEALRLPDGRVIDVTEERLVNLGQRFLDHATSLDASAGTPPPTHWQPIATTLPKQRIRVLTWDGLGEALGFIDFDGAWKADSGNPVRWPIEKWMPLPAAPARSGHPETQDDPLTVMTAERDHLYNRLCAVAKILDVKPGQTTTDRATELMQSARPQAETAVSLAEWESKLAWAVESYLEALNGQTSALIISSGRERKDAVATMAVNWLYARKVDEETRASALAPQQKENQ